MILIIVTVTPLRLLLGRRVVDTSITAAAKVTGYVAAFAVVVDAVDVGLLLFRFAYHTLALCFGQQPLLLWHAASTTGRRASVAVAAERLDSSRFRFDLTHHIALVRVVLLARVVPFSRTAVLLVAVRYCHATDNLQRDGDKNNEFN